MLLTVWRHGEAEAGTPDRERRLTKRGHRDLERGIPVYREKLAGRGLSAPDALYHSPWERTTQTADHIARETGLAREPLRALAPGATIDAVEEALAALSSSDHIILVSHQPLVSSLVDHWLGVAGRVPALSPGAFAVLSAELWAQDCAALCFWAAPPAWDL